MKKIAVYLFPLLMLACLISAPKQQPDDVKKPSQDVTFTSQAYSVDYAVCVAEAVNVRACGSMSCAVLDTLPDGTPVILIAWGEWMLVEYLNGEKLAEGFIFKKYICERNEQ